MRGMRNATAARVTAGKSAVIVVQTLRPQRAATIGPTAPRTNSVGIQYKLIRPRSSHPRPRGAFLNDNGSSNCAGQSSLS